MICNDAYVDILVGLLRFLLFKTILHGFLREHYCQSSLALCADVYRTVLFPPLHPSPPFLPIFTYRFLPSSVLPYVPPMCTCPCLLTVPGHLFGWCCGSFSISLPLSLQPSLHLPLSFSPSQSLIPRTPFHSMSSCFLILFLFFVKNLL